MREEKQYNAEDPKQIEAAERKAKREKFLRDETIRNLMSNKDGRSWVHYLLTQGDMFGNPHVRGDSHDSAFNMGMANMARLIWIEVERVVPEACILMLKEARENEKPDPTDAA